jgi:hypothetical protein
MHFAAHITRNWMIRQDFPREQMQALWEAVHTIPESVKRWRGEESLLEMRARLRNYDEHWNFPKLYQVFDEALNDPNL